MRAPPVTSEIPKEPAYRRAWVIYQLNLRGLSFSELARRHGVSRFSIQNAMMRPSYPMELCIAKALGLKVEELFPERYDPHTGRRLHPVRGAKPSTANRPRNVYSPPAA